MAGGCIVQRVDENLTYDYLYLRKRIWSTPGRAMRARRLHENCRMACSYDSECRNTKRF